MSTMFISKEVPSARMRDCVTFNVCSWVFKVVANNDTVFVSQKVFGAFTIKKGVSVREKIFSNI